MLRSSRTLHGMEWPIHGMESSIHGMLRPIHGQFLAVVWVHFYQHFFFLSHFGALRRSHGRLHPRAAVQQKRTAVARRSAPNAAARGETLKKQKGALHILRRHGQKRGPGELFQRGGVVIIFWKIGGGNAAPVHRGLGWNGRAVRGAEG